MTILFCVAAIVPLGKQNHDCAFGTVTVISLFGPHTVIALLGPQTVIASSVCCLHFRNFIGSLHVRQEERKTDEKISKEVLDNSFIVTVQ